MVAISKQRLLLCLLPPLLAACTSQVQPVLGPEVLEPQVAAESCPEVGVDPSLLAAEEEKVASARAEVVRWRERAQEAEVSLALAEERNRSLSLELESALAELVSPDEEMQTVDSRPLAISRIAEVRVQLDNVDGGASTDVAAQLESAHEYLKRAEEALAQEKYAAAGYLAGQASDKIRRAHLVEEIRASRGAMPEGAVPIVPPRDLRVRVNANLREGPSLDRPRLRVLGVGATLRSLARLGEWLWIETEGGQRGWIFAKLVDELPPSLEAADAAR